MDNKQPTEKDVRLGKASKGTGGKLGQDWPNKIKMELAA